MALSGKNLPKDVATRVVSTKPLRGLVGVQPSHDTVTGREFVWTRETTSDCDDTKACPQPQYSDGTGWRSSLTLDAPLSNVMEMFAACVSRDSCMFGRRELRP